MLKSRVRLPAAAIFAGAAAMCVIAATTVTAAPTAPDNPTASVHGNEEYARTQIISDGYTKVTDLHQTAGGWTAKALEDGKPVSLIVSSIGVQKQ